MTYPGRLHNSSKRYQAAHPISQVRALKAVNKELISLYWDIGQMIIDRQEGKTWGKSVVE